MDHVQALRAAALALAAAATLVGCAGGSPPAPPVTVAPTSSGPSSAPFWTTPPDRPLAAATTERLQAALDEYVSRQDVPGATAAVVTTGGTWAGAAGTDGAGAPLSTTSAFAIASITKTFVAAEVMVLSARGELRLDAPVTDHVDLPFDADGATVRDLLGMTSGFPTDPIAQLVDPSTGPDREWTAQEAVGLAAGGTHQGRRGGETSYNNLNFLVLGLLVEQVTGDELGQVLRRDLIGPAGLERTWFQTSEVPVPPLTVAATRPGSVVVDADGPFMPSRGVASAVGAAGGMAADAPSLARWGHLLYGGQVVDSRLVEQMTSVDAEEDWYGLGTMVFGTGDDRVVGHEGDLAVYHSLLGVWPGSATSVAVLVPGRRPLASDEALTPAGLAHTLEQIVSG